MTDSPRLSLPIDPEERPIEGHLLEIRSKLELLKADKANYVKSEDVMQLYEEVIHQVNDLNAVRKNKRHEQNRGRSNLHRHIVLKPSATHPPSKMSSKTLE